MHKFLRDFFGKNNINQNISYQEYEIQTAKQKQIVIISCIVIITIIIILSALLLYKKFSNTQQPDSDTNHNIVQKTLVNPTVQIASNPSASAPLPASSVPNLNNTNVIPAQSVSNNIQDNVNGIPTKVINTAPADPTVSNSINPTPSNTTVAIPNNQVAPVQTVQPVAPTTSVTSKQVPSNKTKVAKSTRVKATQQAKKENRKKAVPTHSKKEKKVPVHSTKVTNKTTQKLTAKEVLRGKTPNRVSTPPRSYNNDRVIIQAGAFSTRENAKKMQQKITALGYHSTISMIRKSTGVIYRVQIPTSRNNQSSIENKLRSRDIDNFTSN